MCLGLEYRFSLEIFRPFRTWRPRYADPSRFPTLQEALAPFEMSIKVEGPPFVRDKL